MGEAEPVPVGVPLSVLPAVPLPVTVAVPEREGVPAPLAVTLLLIVGSAEFEGVAAPVLLGEVVLSAVTLALVVCVLVAV